MGHIHGFAGEDYVPGAPNQHGLEVSKRPCCNYYFNERLKTRYNMLNSWTHILGCPRSYVETYGDLIFGVRHAPRPEALNLTM